MRVLRAIEELHQVPGPVALAIGVFDGLHLGHQEVIRAALEHAAHHRGTAVVMSFDPHPLKVLRPGQAPKRLCGAPYREVLLERLGVNCTLLCPFTTEMAVTPAGVFVQNLVNACQPLGCISVGYTWTFGRGRTGNIHELMDIGQAHGFAVYGVPPIRIAGEVVSSTLVRDAVTAGNLDRASRFLGRPYALFGKVREGRRLARELGFPTANIIPEAEILPPFGVYAVEVEWDGRWLPGVANLGLRPTIEKEGVAPSLEVHLFDWAGDLYGRDLEVRMGPHLRPEVKFAGIKELKAQIQEDAERARSFFRC